MVSVACVFEAGAWDGPLAPLAPGPPPPPQAVSSRKAVRAAPAAVNRLLACISSAPYARTSGEEERHPRARRCLACGRSTAQWVVDEAIGRRLPNAFVFRSTQRPQRAVKSHRVLPA